MRKLLYTSLGLLLSAALTQCVPTDFELGEVGETEGWRPNFGLPLVNTTFTLEDLLDNLEENDILKTQADGLLTLVYQDSLEFVPEINLDLPDSILIPIAQKEQSVSYDVPGDMRVDRMTLKGSQLGYQIFNPFDEPVDFTLSLHNFTSDGNKLIISLSLPPGQPGNPSELLGSVSLNAYDLELGQDFQTSYTAELPDGSPVELLPFLLTIRNLDFSYIQGYLGELEVQVPLEVLDFQYLDSWDTGDLTFLGPALTFDFQHNVGVPMALRTDSLAFNTFQRGVVPMENDMLNGGFELNYPSPAEAGQLTSTLLRLDADNSNLVQAVSGIPNDLRYAFTLQGNPDGNANATNHLTDAPRLRLNIEAELPLFLRAKDLEVADTLEYSFDETVEQDLVEEVEFKLITNNGFPVSVEVQAYFLDGTEQVVDSLFSEGPAGVEAAEVDAEGNVVSKTPKTQVVPFTKDGLQAILDQTEHIRVVALAETGDQGGAAARLRETDEIDIQLGAFFRLNP